MGPSVVCYLHLRPIHNEQRGKRKQKFSLMFVIYSFIFMLVVLSNLMLYLSLVNIPQLIPFSLLPPANEVAKVMFSVMYRTLAPPPHVFKHVQIRPYCGWLAFDWLASCSFQHNKYQGVNNWWLIKSYLA